MRHILILLFSVGIWGWAAPSYALFGVEFAQLDQFCGGQSPRSTFVYVDTRIVDSEEISWAEQLINKLLANLAPHERVTVIALDTVNAATDEIWSTCYPGLWPEEPREEGGFFTESTSDKLAIAQSAFRKQLTAAIETVIVEHGNGSDDARANIVRALVNDTARYARLDTVPRLIIYSDFVENSDIAHVARGDSAAAGRAAAERFEAQLHDAVVYGFGVGKGHPPPVKGDARQFFAGFVHAADGYLMGISSALTMPSTPPATFFTYDLRGMWQDRKLAGTLVVMADEDGQLQDSYLSIIGMGAAAIAGTLVCGEEVCEIEAKAARGVATNSPGETLYLKGPSSEMKGYIGWPAGVTPDGKKAVVPLTAIVESEQ